MIYFIGGLQNREFKYFDTIKKIRDKNTGIVENFFDADIKEEEKFLEKISFNSIFSVEELVVLKRSEKLKDLEKTLDYMGTLDINNKEIIIDYFKEDGKIGVKLSKKLETMKKEGKMEVHLFLKEDDKKGGAIIEIIKIVIRIMAIGVGITAVGGIGYGAILYASAQDNAAQVQNARAIIRNVVIGIIAFSLMTVFLNFIIPGGVIG